MMNRYRYHVAAGLLLASALLSWTLTKSEAVRYEVSLNQLPMTIGPWEGKDSPLQRPDIVYAVLETSAVLSRQYVKRDRGGETVDLLVTYFGRGHRGFHPPEVSFVASGNQITESDRVILALADGASGPRLEANRFIGRTAGGEVLFLYWFGIGDRLMASYYKGSLYLLWSAMLRRSPPASMVRVALSMRGADRATTMATAGEFVRLLVPILPRYLVERPERPRR